MGLKSMASSMKDNSPRMESPKMGAYKQALHKSLNKKVDSRKLRGFFGHKSTIKGVSNG